FLLSPRPPAAPLLPYTTLFRSAGRCQVAAHLRHRPPPARAAGRAATGPGARAFAAAGVVPAPGPARPAIAAAPGQHRARAELARDRKSTRLNSSHVKISYAVFC